MKKRRKEKKEGEGRMKKRRKEKKEGYRKERMKDEG